MPHIDVIWKITQNKLLENEERIYHHNRTRKKISKRHIYNGAICNVLEKYQINVDD